MTGSSGLNMKKSAERYNSAQNLKGWRNLVSSAMSMAATGVAVDVREVLNN